MDFCPNGTLVTHLKKMTNGLIDRYFDGLVSGVCYIHSLRIVHGNIKLQNIFVNAKNKAVLTDFGFSYKLPENCDSYAVGVVLRCLVLKRRPGYCPDYLQEVKESPHVCAMFRGLHGRVVPKLSARGGISLHSISAKKENKITRVRKAFNHEFERRKRIQA
ncbi:hal protein kinase [Plakobranchus ocellatus]|uniref:Hal protein kinase n=1 Tax=Plakobranchus ocellatus TaxID=259542 RepID=A0AAV4C5J1_9GAST|nr:hal protein kinase [Plakobranchus ocellatus]